MGMTTFTVSIPVNFPSYRTRPGIITSPLPAPDRQAGDDLEEAAGPTGRSPHGLAADPPLQPSLPMAQHLHGREKLLVRLIQALDALHCVR